MEVELDGVLVFIDSRVNPPSKRNPAFFHASDPFSLTPSPQLSFMLSDPDSRLSVTT